ACGYREELSLLDPEAIYLLGHKHGYRVELTLKRSVYANEMSLFRYDVVIHVNEASAQDRDLSAQEIPILSGEGLSLSALASRLEDGGARLVVRGLPNARLWRDAEVSARLRQLEEGDERLTKSDVGASGSREELSLLDPEAIYLLGHKHGYRVELMFSPENAERYFDAYFVREELAPGLSGVPIGLQYGTRKEERTSWSDYANQPTMRDADRLFISGLRDTLSRTLPDYMVPSSFVVLERLPLTANGKLDVRALPDPEVVGEGAYRAPETPTEVLLCDLYAELTGASRVGLDDSFFALGGHSLLAMRLVARVREALGLELPLRALFERPQVETLSLFIDAELQATTPTTVRGEIIPGSGRQGEEVILSYGQARMWALDRIEGGTAGYNMPAALRLRGDFDVGAFGAALRDVVLRHEPLRTVIIEGTEGAVGRLRDVDADEALVAYEDLSDLADADLEEAIKARIDAESDRVFDLSRDLMV
ncbi:MAG: condensation domain-containing protein, partial [Methylocystis sp.]